MRASAVRQRQAGEVWPPNPVRCVVHNRAGVRGARRLCRPNGQTPAWRDSSGRPRRTRRITPELIIDLGREAMPPDRIGLIGLELQQTLRFERIAIFQSSRGRGVAKPFARYPSFSASTRRFRNASMRLVRSIKGQLTHSLHAFVGNRFGTGRGPEVRFESGRCSELARLASPTACLAALSSCSMRSLLRPRSAYKRASVRRIPMSSGPASSICRRWLALSSYCPAHARALAQFCWSGRLGAVQLPCAAQSRCRVWPSFEPSQRLAQICPCAPITLPCQGEHPPRLRRHVGLPRAVRSFRPRVP